MNQTLKPQWIDEFILKDHFYLNSNDCCLFFTEFIKGQGFNGTGNQLITNLKIKPSEIKRLHHKKRAVEDCVQLMIDGIGLEKLQKWIMIPIPPSKSKSDPEYDDRLLQILSAIQGKGKQNSIQIDYIDLFSTITSRKQTSITDDKRPTPKEHIKNWHVDHSTLSRFKGNNIIIFDDVITTGSQFKAAKNLILQIFPQSNIYGIFIARRVP